MYFDDWVKWRLGKAIDFDGVYGAQCVDEIKDFEKHVIDLTPQACGDAWEYYAKYDNNSFLRANFTKIPYTRGFVPKKGDIVVWSTGLGKYGHVAIATGQGDTNGFYSYDQNWKVKAMTKVYHTYDYVYGVLRPKNQSNINGSPAPTPSGTFKVKVTADTLRVRKGAGVNYGIATNVHKGEVYTITQTVKNGAYTWGKLISGAGWIALDYTVRI